MSSSTVTTTHDIEAEQELRVDVPKGSVCTVKLLKGFCEVFGMELAQNQSYKYEGPTHFAIFTWYPDCQVELTGIPADACYAADDTQMKSYAGIHGRLNWKRDEARRVGADGPRVLVVGPTDSGKSTLCQILLAYGVRAGYAPVFVDLDVGQSTLSIPGTIGAAVLSPREITPNRGISAARPMVYWFGDKSPDSLTGMIGDGSRYGGLLSTLANAVDERTATDEAVRASGVVVNMCGRVDEIGYQEILQVVQLYSIELVIVLGHDRLFSKINKELNSNVTRKGPRLASNPDSSIVTIKLPRSGGATERDTTRRKNIRANLISKYFYGSPLNNINLSPMEHDINFSEIELFELLGSGGGINSGLSSGVMSLGGSSSSTFGSSDDNNKKALKLTKLDFDNSLNHSILAVVHKNFGKNTTVAADTESLLRELGSCSVCGFVAVTAVNMDTRTITILSPSSESLPSRCLVRGNIT
jgi:polyribonucleotide 5'-hydroxyl-kinase